MVTSRARHRAPDRRQTGRRAERVLQLGQGAIRLLRDQRGQSVQVRLQHPAPPVPLDARCDFARLPPALLQQPHPRPAHAVLHRDVRGLHPGITVEQGSFSEIHRIGLHRSSCIGVCRSTTTSPSSTRAI